MVHLRLATWDELPLLAEIGDAAFRDDPIYLHFNPWRSVYPEEWRRSFLQTLRSKFAEPGNVVIAAEIEDENGQKVLVGYLTAIRRGSDGNPMSSWMQHSSKYGLQIATPAQQEEAHASKLKANRSADPAKVARFYSEEIKVLGGSQANTIEMQTIAVHPGHQRSGVGKACVKWIFDAAEEEGVPCVADGSEKGIGLYVKVGWKILGTVVLEDGVARLESTQTVVALPRVEVPVIRWTPGDFRGV